VHAHPPTATGFAAAGIPLDRPLIAEAVMTLGAVPIIPYGQPSTDELARSVGDAICSAHALLMANHGAITVGDGIYRAWERMETVEQLAKVALVTRILGQDRLLSGSAVEGLLAARTASGYPPPACAPGMEAAPIAARAADPTAGTDGTVTLTRRELVRLIEDAVERFGGAGRGRA
jgi:L-fuculose-phosphate aldolase